MPYFNNYIIGGTKMQVKKFLGVYNIYFKDDSECNDDINLLADLFVFRKFSIYIRQDCCYSKVAYVFDNRIFVGEKYDKLIGNVLKSKGLPYKII